MSQLKKYLVLAPFACGKDAAGIPVIFQKGSVYEGERAEEFLQHGLLKSMEEHSLEQLQALEKEIAVKKAELAALTEKLNVPKPKASSKKKQ